MKKCLQSESEKRGYKPNPGQTLSHWSSDIGVEDRYNNVSLLGSSRLTCNICSLTLGMDKLGMMLQYQYINVCAQHTDVGLQHLVGWD